MLPALLGSLLFCGFAGLLVAARDRVDRAIGESEARFRDISQAASDWIWETDAALRLTFVSEACHRSLGITPASLVGRQLQELLLPLDGAPLPEARYRGAGGTRGRSTTPSSVAMRVAASRACCASQARR